MKESINYYFARQKAKLFVRFMIVVLWGSSFLILGATYYAASSFEESLQRASATLDRIAKQQEAPAPKQPVLTAQVTDQPTISNNLRPKIISVDSFSIPTMSRRLLIREKLIVHSGMAIGEVDSFYVVTGTGTNAFNNFNKIAQYYLTFPLNGERHVVPLPFYIKNSRVVLNGTLYDSRGEPFMMMHNDTLENIRNRRNQDGKHEHAEVLFSPYNIIITDPDGYIALCLQHVVGGDNSSFRLTGYFWTNDHSQMIIVGKNAWNVVARIPQDEFDDMYKVSDIRSPFYSNDRQEILQFKGVF